MSSGKLSSNDQITELSKSEQILNLANDNGSDEPQSNASSQTNLDSASLTDKLSVQNKPHSVHSLNDAIKSDSSAVHNDEDLVKSDSQLNNLDDSFISPETKIDRNNLNRSLENLKQNSFDLLEPKSSSASSNKASLNNLLLDERSLNELSIGTGGGLVKSAPIETGSLASTPAINTPLNNTPISQTTFLDPASADDTAPLLDQASISIVPTGGRPPPSSSATKGRKTSSLGELNEFASQKLRDKGKLSTGSIDFILSSLSQSSVPDSNRINIGLEDEMIIESYELSLCRQLAYYVACFLTIGLLLIYCEIKLSLKVRLTHRRCALERSTMVVLIDGQNNEYVESMVRPDQDEDNISNGHIHFYHKKMKYIWNSDKQRFVRLVGLEAEKCEVIYSYSSGLSENEAEEKFSLYGPNSIHIDVQPLWKIVVDSLKNPFYVYQAFIVIVWCVQLYYQFAFCVFTFSIITLALQGYETRKQNKQLRAKVQSENEITVIRSSCAQKMSSNKLVPGDLLVINKPCSLNCDLVLLEGNCTVNESMLTGECVPIAKTSLRLAATETYSPRTNKKNTLYCGTEILQVQAPDAGNHAKAVVVRTGYSTAKGELVRAILFPKESNTLLNSDMVKCMQMFFILGLPCMLYTAWTFSTFKLKTFDLILVVIDIATFLIPPLLPSVMTSVNVHAQKRLLKKEIFCLNASCINPCGVLDTTVFDKTGTITEDSLDFASVLPAFKSKEQELIRKFVRNKNEEDENLNEIKKSDDEESATKEKSGFSDEPWTYLKDKDLNNLIMTVGCCHSLIYFENKVDGDVLDLKMFDQLDWTILNSKAELEEMSKLFPSSLKLDRVIKTSVKNAETNERLAVGIVKEFQFESINQRMMVIAKPILYAESSNQQNGHRQSNGSISSPNVNVASNLNNNSFLVLSKGAPEKIEKFCKPETVPANYNEILYSYTVQGFRVIACASKVVNLSKLDNLSKAQITDFEDGLTFDGLIVFHNKIKRQSKPTILELREIDMRCLMATGDNLLTAVNVSRNCGLIDQQDQVIELKAELVDSGLSKAGNCFVDRNEYIEYVECDQPIKDKQIRVIYKLLKNPSQVQHHHLTKLFRKESHHHDQDEVIINMLDNSVTKYKKETANQLKLVSWFSRRTSDQKTRLHKMINDLDDDSRVPYLLCCEGSTFALLRYHNERIFKYLTHKGIVFARMSPKQKEQLIRSLQDQEHIVAMVGDGANDCAALRNSNAGLALSSEESAVAAPFSTSHTNIAVFKYLICEGKATISATFGAFKYQVSYCFILLSAVMLLFYDGAFPSDVQYIISDIILNLAPPLVFGTTAACYRLVKRKPNSVLFGFSTLFSIFSFVVIQTSFYFFARYLLTRQVWYEPFKFEKDLLKASAPSHVATTILSVNMFSYVISAIVFSPGHPFRKSFFSNKLYMAVVFLNLMIVLSLSVFPLPTFVVTIINFKVFPDFNFKIYLLLISIVNFIVSYLWEVVFLQSVVPALQERYSNLKWNSKPKIHEKLDHELSTIKWPPVLFDNGA